ncbi:survival motor neuron [Diplodia corticola]|uniref:Survival motor neuron n=1 Tax=Diplodia corticola TaxID=236234 RepID=A0A1J9QRJ8_9PEZI|nr:survival motor neuron [Diplodia corticola]OJD31041.1 survival motor neuron [Diplodia corticola]
MTGIDIFAQGAWDDRALVKGWNAQVNEYKKYHSLQKRDKKVPLSEMLTAAEIFDLADLAEPEELEEMGISAHAQSRAKLEHESQGAHTADDGTAYQPPMANHASDAAAPSEETDAAALQLMQEAEMQNVAQPPSAPPMPGTAHATAPGQGDALKNMQMAFYYAGYYQHQYETQLQSAQKSG